jgi:hypothetical protein
MAESQLGANTEFVVASSTTKKIFSSRASPYGVSDGSFFFQEPTTGALIVRPDLRLKAHEAILTEARRIQLRLYRGLPGLYLRKIGLQLRSAAVQCQSKACGYLLDFAGYGHRGSPYNR